MAAPVTDHYACPPGSILAAGRGVVPAWAPSAGQIKQISHPAGYFGTNQGATCAEISPAYQSWNPNAPNQGPYAPRGYGWHTVHGYCGASFNEDTRQLVCYNAGHVSANASAPFCFDLTDLRWKWLDVPLPHDSLALVTDSYPTQAQVEEYYPPEQYNYDWGDFNGSWSGWPSGFGQPGKIQPLTSHTYANRVCIPATIMGNSKGGFLTYGSYEGVINASGNADGSHLFDFDSKTWARTNNVWPGGASNGHAARCDRLTGKVVAFGVSTGAGRFRIFDPVTRQWAGKNQTTSTVTTNTDQPGANIHDAARLFIVPRQIQANGQDATWQYYGTWYKFHAVSLDAVLGAGAATFVQLTVNVIGGWPLNARGDNEFIGWAYCPEDKALYAINGENASNKYWKLSPPAGAVTQSDYLTGTWTLTEHTFISGTLSSPDARSHMFNRLSWDAWSRSFVWFPNAVAGAVQAFRPEGI